MISKSLDRFLVAKTIVDDSKRMKFWVGNGGSLDHLPILH
jgi:hypothetical protein